MALEWGPVTDKLELAAAAAYAQNQCRALVHTARYCFGATRGAVQFTPQTVQITDSRPPAMSLRVGRAKLEVEIEALPSVTLTLADDRDFAKMVSARAPWWPQNEAHLRSKVLHLLADASACDW